MVLMNYHEMTMDQPKGTRSSRQQFLVICTVMVAFLAYSALTSGLLEPIAPIEGVFPGGYYVYKHTNRDYASFMGLGRRIASDIYGEKAKANEKRQAEPITYYMFLDDPSIMGGRRQRFRAGIMGGDSEMGKLDHLESLNEKKKLRPVTSDEYLRWAAKDVFAKIPYEKADLPSVDALVLQFPFSSSFTASLIFSYRVIPKLRKLAQEKAGDEKFVPVIVTNCDWKQEMCTHYVPLVQGRDFLLGHPDSSTFNQDLGPESFLDWNGAKDGLRKLLPSLDKYLK